MAFGDPDRDAYGNPISIPPHNQIFIDKNNRPMARRTKIRVDDTLELTDDPATDATIISVHGISKQSVNIVDTITDLRAWTGVFNPDDDFILFRTRGCLAVNDGGDGWYMFQRGFLDTADDGVLTFEVESLIDIGRARFINGGNDSAFLAQRCSTAKSAGTPAYSFDSSGVVPIGLELERVTKLLSTAGYSELKFNPVGTYTSNNTEQICQRPKNVGFTLDFQGALLSSASGSLPNGGAIRFWARAAGDVDAIPTVLLTLGYIADGAHKAGRTWTQSPVFKGGETQFTAVASLGDVGTVPALLAGQDVLVRIGACRTDANGWSDFAYFANVVSIDGSDNVTVDIPIPQLPGFDVGRNLSRTQTEHDLIAIDPNGFQDNVVIKNVILDTVQLDGLYDRWTRYENVHWTKCTFGINATGSIGSYIDVTADTAGYFLNGGFVTLQACQSTKIAREVCGYLNGMYLHSEELSTQGTEIELIDVNWDARSTPLNSVPIVGQGFGESATIKVGKMVLRGGYYAMTVVSTCSIEELHVVGGNKTDAGYASYGIDFSKVGRMTFWNAITESAPRSYSGQEYLKFPIAYPVGAGVNTTTFTCPRAGICRRLRVLATGDLTHIDTIVVNASGFGGTDIKSLLTVGSWVNIPYGQQAGLTFPDFWGLKQMQIVITSKGDGSPPAGAQLYVEMEMFVADPPYYNLSDPNGVISGDTSKPFYLVGDGAPASNADFVTQVYLDSTNKAFYDAVSVGAGAGDWKLRGDAGTAITSLIGDVSASGPGAATATLATVSSAGVYGNAAFTPQITIDAKGRTTDITGLAIAIASGQVSGLAAIATSGSASDLGSGTVPQARLPTGTPVLIASGDFTASSISESWASNAYKNVLVTLDVSVGNSADPLLTIAGQASGTYYSRNGTLTSGGAGMVTQSDQNAADNYALTNCGQYASMWLEMQLRSGPYKGIKFEGVTAYNGSNADVKTMWGRCSIHDITATTGFTITFGGSTQGHIEVWGYP